MVQIVFAHFIVSSVANWCLHAKGIWHKVASHFQLLHCTLIGDILEHCVSLFDLPPKKNVHLLSGLPIMVGIVYSLS